LVLVHACAHDHLGMILRIWRTGIDESCADDYAEFARTKSVPMFRSQAGFAGVIFAGRAGERAVLTLWDGRAAVEALDRSDSYKAIVAEIGAAGFLRGDSDVEVFELDAFLLDDGVARPIRRPETASE
jgi:heme-degrading monooxygenase HmoA